MKSNTGTYEEKRWLNKTTIPFCVEISDSPRCIRGGLHFFKDQSQIILWRINKLKVYSTQHKTVKRFC